MLTELEILGNNAQVVGDEEESSLTVQIADMVIEYEFLLKSVLVAMNYEHRGFKVKWARSIEKDGCDTINVVQNDQETRNEGENAAIINELADLLRCIDWICEFKKSFRETLRSIHKNKLIVKNYMRDETIAENSVQYEAPEIEEQYADPKHSTIKDKLLNKTKHLSSNLIKGNQILQSGILQSDLNLDELNQQTSSLSNVNDKYMQFEAVFLKTNQLVKTLEKASHQEKRDVYLALGFLCLSVSWVLWRRIFRLPTRLALFVLFKFFKGILVTVGFVSRIPSTKTPILAPSVIVLGTPSSSLTTAIDSIEQAVDEAMDRILSHDEL